MSDMDLRRCVGIAGLVAAILVLIEVPLYFVYSGPPPDSNVLTRSLFGIVGMTVMIVFMAGFRQLVKQIAPGVEWIGGLAATAGLMWVLIEFVSTGLETGAVIQSAKRIDPTITVSGTYILYGSISRLVLGLFLLSFGYAVLRSGILSRWVGRSAQVLAVVNLAFVPSLFFGNEPAHFYAANGWGTTASMGGLFTLWLLAASVSIVRSGKAGRRIERHGTALRPDAATVSV